MLRVPHRALFFLFCSLGFTILVMITVRKMRLKSVHSSHDDEQRKTENVMNTLRLFSSVTENTMNFSVIEPFILWELVPEREHDLLESKGFQLNTYCRNKDMITLAVYEYNVGKLTDVVMKTRLEISGFRMAVYHSSVGPWVRGSKESSRKTVTSHIIYLAGDAIIHVVVFRVKPRYLWSWGISNSDSNDISTSFVIGRSDAMFDRFQTVPFPSEGSTIKNLFVPSNIPAFLLQVETSTHAECKNLIKQTSQTKNTTSSKKSKRPPLWLFEDTTRSVIDELKKLLDPSLTRFWLASGSLLGWYRQCGLIPYTHDLDFAAWGTDLDQKLIDNFKKSESIRFNYALGNESEDMEFWLKYKWLSVDLFFMYENNQTGGLHAGAHRPGFGYSFKYMYPKFELCSTDFLSYRVLVPCTSEAVIEAEYGRNWRLPKEGWNYELSARNVLGRRYWGSEEIQRYDNYTNS